MTEQVDCIVVGAGVVGIAVARALALAGREVIVLEREGGIGTGISSRNSEVIHAGIYYPPDSLMARLCVAGRHMLYAYCGERGVPHDRCGKLIVACDEAEAARLPAIQARAEANGVEGMRLLDAAGARALEPALRCAAALHSPETGILDSHAYMLALQGDAEAAGAMFAFRTEVTGGRARGDGVEVFADITLRAATVVNAAGLQAPAIARRIEGMPNPRVPTPYLAKGNYFSLAGRAPFSRLIYPVPVPGGLGTHLTLDMGHQARFGPDVEWVEREDYDVDPARGEGFYASIRRWWPGLPDGSLSPAYSGIRPKIAPQGAAGQDFRVQTARDHGVAGLINLFGIESPGLTAAIALADLVRDVANAD